MTEKYINNFECQCCGKDFEGLLTSDVTTLGAPDLDCRPPETVRSTMDEWVHECPHCGYINNGEQEESFAFKELLESNEYKTCEGIDFQNPVAKKFYRYAMILLKKEKFAEACLNFLTAAWCCDDANEKENAIICRKKFLEFFDKIEVEDENLMMMKADVLRRTGAFDEVIDIEDYMFENQILNQILTFQKEKSREKNTDCFTMDDVLGIE